MRRAILVLVARVSRISRAFAHSAHSQKDVTRLQERTLERAGGRGAAWTEDRRRSSQGRRRPEGEWGGGRSPEASRQTELVLLVLLVLRTAGNLQEPVRTLLHFGNTQQRCRDGGRTSGQESP